MDRANFSFNLPETSFLVDRILRNYKRDRNYFEHYSPKFDHDFIVGFEEKVETLIHPTPLQLLENEILKKTEKMQITINHFRPLLDITEVLLQKVADEPCLQVAGLSLNQVRESLSRQCSSEIQKSCRQMISELELCIDELIDKGFIMRILNDFHLLIEKLKNCETELTNVTRQYNMIAGEYELVNTQVEEYIETIITATPAVFGELYSDKREEYSIDHLMMQA
jgi:hypothetical protein